MQRVQVTSPRSPSSNSRRQLLIFRVRALRDDRLLRRLFDRITRARRDRTRRLAIECAPRNFHDGSDRFRFRKTAGDRAAMDEHRG